MCFEIKEYTLGCTCRLYQGDQVIAIHTQGCKHKQIGKPAEICDPILNGRTRELIQPTFKDTSCVVHQMLRNRGDDPKTLAPYVHKSLAQFIEAKAPVRDDAFRNLKRVVETEVNTKIMLARYIGACQAVNPERALARLEEDLDFEVSAIQGPRGMIQAALPGFLKGLLKDALDF